MTALVRAELRKLRSVRSAPVVLAAIAAVAVLVTIAGTTTAGTNGNAPLTSGSYLDILRGPLSILTGAVLILGILAVAGEYRHGTVVGTYLVTPRRQRVVAAKAFAIAITGVASALVISIVTTAVALPLFAGKHVTMHVGSGRSLLVVLGVAAAAALYGALGVGLGAALRNQTAAITVALVWMLAVEGLIPNILHRQTLGRWLPWGAVKAIAQWDGALPAAAGAGLLLTYAAALLVAGVFLVRRADVV
jgi:ABC-2 type transport system permease protein